MDARLGVNASSMPPITVSGSYSTLMALIAVEGRVLVDGRHRGHRVADEAHPVGAERVLVLADRQDAEGDRHFSGENGETRRARSAARVSMEMIRVAAGGCGDLADQHARQRQVVGELREARHLRAAIHAAEGLADRLEPFAPARRTAGPVGPTRGVGAPLLAGRRLRSAGCP